MTGLVFGKLFFPKSDPIVGVLEAFGVFFIGFVGRPIGAAIFGHWGDRIGRKATLIVTLLVTGCATVAVGLVPYRMHASRERFSLHRVAFLDLLVMSGRPWAR